MAYNPNRLSTMTSVSNSPRPGGGPQSAQVSTQTLLNALHNTFLNSRPHSLEFSTSLAINTWVTDQNISPDGRVGGVVDQEFADRVWQHARRRAEDGSVVLGSLHQSTPSMLSSFVSALPLQIPGTFYTALSVVRAFTHCVTPNNPSLPRFSSLAASCTLNQEGDLLGVSFALSTSGLDTQNGLLKVPAEAGYRAFDVFYYLNVSSASKAEREFLGLKPCSAYSLLRRSGTFSPPSYLPTADDAAAAEDFRHGLRAIGIKGPAMHNLISTLAGILKLGDTLDAMADADAVYNICDDVAVLLDMDATILRVKCTTEERAIFIAGLYESVVDWVIRHANEAIKQEMKNPRAMGSVNGSGPGTPRVDDANEDTVCINVIEVPDSNLGKAIAFRTVFDDTQGINLEMKEDGVPIVPAGATVLNEMKAVVAACGPDMGEMDSAAGRERDMERDRREGVLEKIAHQCEGGFLKELLHPVPGQGVVLGDAQTGGRVHLSNTLNSSRVWFHLSLHPTDEPPSTLAAPGNHWSAAAVSTQLRAWRLPEWANRRNRQLDFTADFDPVELVDRYAPLGCHDGKEGIETWLLERGWTNGEVVIGETRIWLRESAWWEAECMKDALPPAGAMPLESGYSVPTPGMESGFFSEVPPGSRDQLLTVPRNSGSTRAASVAAPSRRIIPGDYGLGTRGDQYKGEVTYEGQDPELGEGKVIEERSVGLGRRLWVALAWILTIWMPSPFLRYIGRMKRSDVRLAWREKVSLVFIILLINAVVVFYIIFFGKLLCPNWDKAWDTKQVGFHQGTNDYWVSHRGRVYDLTKFYKIQHSDTNIPVTNDVMMPFAGTNIDELVAPPLTLACPNLVTDDTLILTANVSVSNPTAIHTQGPFFQPDPLSKLRSITWYTDRFLPTMNKYHKGDLVWDINYVRVQGQANYNQWVIIDGSVYDLTDYFNTKLNVRKNVATYAFMPSWFEDMVQGNNGADVTTLFDGEGNKTSKAATLQCLKNYFYTGRTDYRKTPRCQVNNYMLLAFTIILCIVILTKFLAALQLGSKRRPSPQDKFVICQVPAYTEGEDQLRKGLDSLTALQYDNKRKLMCVICDGVIVGAGNDRPTPKMVLDILGVDPKADPPALPFKSVGQGSEQLNYGKVYSGLYEFEGNVVPYLVVVKLGKQSEQNKPKPGNRGKRDSQILLMSFLNRVHHRSPMSPLELEMFHQINNVIGVDPELYEYLFMVDADTMVKEDSLNRLVAACANDSKIAGICGETSLQNQEGSWWTMIQVYEYYISHHLAKAFESLFGSVTCLPGCFCMYRLRTADKGRPLIISDKVIKDYSDGDVDTLHKKNLLSLGEDRYLTTLMMKHFPGMSYKFVPTALAFTAAPDTWSVLLSQRRRWINSTIHNLAELVFLKDMCGFCCFSMRFVVFIDLFGTIILPATCAYLGYLLYLVGTKTGQFPLISIVMLAAVYGLQAVIFIIKRQWQHIGWMVIYIIAFPIYSFVLPIYSFWMQDDFSWGSTRMVLEEKGKSKVVQFDKDDGFNPRDIPLMRWDDYAAANELPGGRGEPFSEKLAGAYEIGHGNALYELDDIRSVTSSVKPGSYTGGMGGGLSMPNPVVGARGSMYTLGTSQQRASFMGQAAGAHRRSGSVGSDVPLARPTSTVYPVVSGSAEHLPHSPNASATALRSRSALGLTPPSGSPRPVSMAASTHLGVDVRAEARMSAVSLGPVNFMDGPKTGPSDAEIAAAVRECLAEVDIERFTKKQLVALVELKLQCQVAGERKKVLERWIDVELERLPV